MSASEKHGTGTGAGEVGAGKGGGPPFKKQKQCVSKGEFGRGLGPRRATPKRPSDGRQFSAPGSPRQELCGETCIERHAI